MHSKKVRELNRNPHCSLGAYDAWGNYFVIQGEVASTVSVDSGAYYRGIMEGIWAEHGEHLKAYFQDGPEGRRLVLLEFIPATLTVISSKHGIASESNNWRPAEIERAAAR